MTSQKQYSFAIGFICLLSGFISIAQGAETIVLYNPLPVERMDELVVLSRKLLQQKLGNIGPGQFVQITNKDKQPVLVQFDDLDQDGNWDEAALLYTFKANEKVTLGISVSDQPVTIKAVVRAHVRLRKKNADNSFGPAVTFEKMPLKNPATDFSKQPLPFYLTEGPAWENDKVAFRQYLDVRNARDIFAKRVSHMVMDSVGVVPEPSYHNLADWGMDVLHVGKSLGAGAVALEIKINGKDSIIRIGGDSVTETIYQQVSDGPIRAMFRIKYAMNIEGKKIFVTDETSIWAGQYFYESKLTVEGAPAGSKLVTGIANFYDNKSKHFLANNAGILYSHGKQSENKDELGMAIIVPQDRFTAFGATPDSGASILNTYTVSQRLNGKPASYRFYSAWGMSNPRFKDRAFFEQFLLDEARNSSKPIEISFL